MAHNDDLRVLLDVPFLKNGMVIYVSGQESGPQDQYVAQNRASIREQFAASDSRFIFIPDLLESIPESVQDYLFPKMDYPSLDAVYAHIRKTANLGNKAGLLYQQGRAVFFRVIGSESCQDEIFALAEEFAPENQIRFRMTPAETEDETGMAYFPDEDEVIYPIKKRSKSNSKCISWIRQKSHQVAEAAEGSFDETMGGLFDDLDFSSGEMAYVPPVEKVQPVEEEPPLDERTKAILAEIDGIKSKFGLSVDELMILINYKVQFSHLHISRGGRIFLSDFGKDVKMDTRAQAFYFLFLRHPEGIRFKDMADYRDELLDIYWHLVDRERADVEKTIDNLINPLGNEMNVCSSRIKAAFKNVVGEHVAKFYCIEGPAGGTKKVPLDRDLVIWEY